MKQNYHYNHKHEIKITMANNPWA